MTYACQMMHRRISTTAKENAVVEEKVAIVEDGMTNRMMFTEVILTNSQNHHGKGFLNITKRGF